MGFPDEAGQDFLRVRFKGEPAKTVASLLNPALAKESAAVIDREHHSCVTSKEGETTCGFILDAEGATTDLEEFGYQ